MIKEIAIFILGIFLFSSCGDRCIEQPNKTITSDSAAVNSKSTPCDSLYIQAKNIDTELLKGSMINPALAQKAITAFDHYASNCKQDTLAPVFLIKAGQIAASINKYDQSQVLLKKCVDEFPDFKNRGAALFLIAQLYDEKTMLNDEKEAKKLYEQIIKEYPRTDWDREAKSALANLGKTDDQLIEQFLKKNNK